MKIPETSANVGAYYGNEEQNGQWQSSQQYMVMSPHGMVIDVNNVGSGDHSMHRPPMYHPPGYVIPGGYYGSGPYPPAGPGGPGGVPVPADDFADYMWMENEDEFDKQVMQQLEEEALMEQCIEAMLEDEQRERLRPAVNNGASSASSISLEEAVSRSTLNPLAAEFVPTFAPSTAKTQENKQESPPESTPTVNSDTRADQSSTPNHTEPNTQVTQADTTPEVSAAAAGVQVENTKTKKTDTKKNAKPKSPPVKEVKSEPKLAPKKEPCEAKAVKSESAVENIVKMDDSAIFPVLTKPQPVEESSSTIPKPINYAAAAKANKKKASTPPAPAAVDKPASATKVQESKPTERKPAQKEKPVQRKNSAK